MTASNELNHFPVWPLPETHGVTASWVPYHKHYVTRALPLCGVKVLHPAQIIYLDRRGRGGAYSIVACISHLTIDQASLSRRGTVPTPNRDTSSISAGITFFPIFSTSKILLTLSPSCFAFCQPQLFARIAIVLSLLSTCIEFLHITFVYFPHLLPAHPVPSEGAARFTV